mmetsp:Transcript_2799/g.6833  ORF Transcript_2799/g.6833 Transcript_2799/m.6833 type:complete len:508 (-) Transcript_2799:98-1621(-)|eukprot:CAMPEP_0114553422 /NCGR_PEP_ID=MMETSP0114-20121206/7652_1 /TAXON_ID=31324 /ORGANISM="Goniomonas sp, Strain m" /LENGTH=507 /DNA_ID=CAMNT_0001738369 /DNA_START=54 /DNA_END=1577 /DNA_ORIENTATION=+
MSAHSQPVEIDFLGVKDSAEAPQAVAHKDPVEAEPTCNLVLSLEPWQGSAFKPVVPKNVQALMEKNPELSRILGVAPSSATASVSRQSASADSNNPGDCSDPEILSVLEESPPLEICTLTHTSTLILPQDYRINLRDLAMGIEVGGDQVGDVVGARFAPAVGLPVERGASGFIRRGKNKDFGNQLQLRLRAAGEARVQVKVFSTGALATTGARTEADAVAAVITVAAWARHAGLPVQGHGPVELRNALCTGFVGSADGVWDVDVIFEFAGQGCDPDIVSHRIKSRGRAAILEVGAAEHEGAHAPRCIIHPSGSVQVMGKVTPAVAEQVYRLVRRFLSRLLTLSPGVLRRRVGRKPKARRTSHARVPRSPSPARLAMLPPTPPTVEKPVATQPGPVPEGAQSQQTATDMLLQLARCAPWTVPGVGAPNVPNVPGRAPVRAAVGTAQQKGRGPRRAAAQRAVPAVFGSAAAAAANVSADSPGFKFLPPPGVVPDVSALPQLLRVLASAV